MKLRTEAVGWVLGKIHARKEDKSILSSVHSNCHCFAIMEWGKPQPKVLNVISMGNLEVPSQMRSKDEMNV